jgi:uncharacterized protein YecT (DUF1311 family)
VPAGLNGQTAGRGVGGRREVLLWAAALLAAGPSRALDNPDAPDRTAEFLVRAQPYEARLADAAGGPEYAPAAADYARFLDSELNQSYRRLLARLDRESRQALVLAQRHWLRFLDAETRFIGGNWTARQFGSSAALSRADYRATLVRQRVLGLLAYLQNYPADES